MATYDPFRDLDRLAATLMDTRRGPRRSPVMPDEPQLWSPRGMCGSTKRDRLTVWRRGAADLAGRHRRPETNVVGDRVTPPAPVDVAAVPTKSNQNAVVSAMMPRLIYLVTRPAIAWPRPSSFI